MHKEGILLRHLIIRVIEKQTGLSSIAFRFTTINWFPIFAGSLRYSSSTCAVLSDGRFLLDDRRGNIPLLICCQSLQR